jgi:hypothetical protein
MENKHHYTRREFLWQSSAAGITLTAGWPGMATSIWARGNVGSPAGSLAAGAWEQDFADPANDYRIGVYWWWFGPAVTKAEVTRELEVMRRAGIGYVLIFPIYPISVDDAGKGIRNLRYLSPEFLDVVGFTTEKAKELGIVVDVLMGTGWPYGGPSITPELAAQRLRMEIVPVDPRGLARVPELKPHEKLEAAWLVTSDGKHTDLAHARDVTESLKGSGEVDLQPLSGLNTLMAFIQSPTGMQVKRPALGAEGLVLDHLSRKAVQTYLDSVAAQLLSPAQGKVRALHSDSFEVFGEEWTPGFLEEFSKRRGYDLRPYLPAMVSDIGPRTEDVRHDYWGTVRDLACDNYMHVLQEWCHAHGVGLQSESYGTPPVDMASFSDVDYPMGEQCNWKTFTPSRWASSAAHQLGKRVTSTEAYTWLRHPRYVATLQDLKLGSDLHFICGINKLVAHGYAYSPPAAGIPGWGYYASVMLNDNNTWWPYFHLLADYVHRVSFALSLGKPVVDIALYLPEDDVMAGQPLGQGLTLNSATESRLAGKKRVPEFGLPDAYQSESPVIKTILTSGFSFDGFDRSLLQPDLRTANGRLELGDVAYRVAVLPNLSGISLPILEKLADFCRSGGTLVATCRLPSVAYGLKDREQHCERVRELMREIFGKQPGNSGHPYGKGRGILVPDEMASLHAVLSSLQPDVKLAPADADVYFLHRAEGSRHVYFFANTSSQHKSLSVVCRDGKGTPRYWDAMTGAVADMPIFNALELGTQIPLELEPYGSALIFFDGSGGEAQIAVTNLPIPAIHFDPSRHRWIAKVSEPGSYFVRTKRSTSRFEVGSLGASIALNGPWSLRDTDKKTGIVLERLKSWTEMPGYRYYSGRLEYEITVNVPSEVVGEGRGLWLDLGEVREIAEVHVNGELAGVCWKLPYRHEVGPWVRAGRNVVSVGVTNLLINRVLGQPDEDFSGLAQPLRFPLPGEKRLIPEPLPSGLLGPVQIIPCVNVDVSLALSTHP